MKSYLRPALISMLSALAFSCVAGEEPEAPVEEAAVGDLDLTPEEEAALDTFGQQCGPNVCTGKTHCCNASCGRCVPLGVECPQEACLAGETDSEVENSQASESHKEAGFEHLSQPSSDDVFNVGQQCGPRFCTGSTPKCCNATCGICVPKGAQCTQEHSC